MQRSLDMTLEIFIGGHDSAMEATLIYSFDPAEGDGWNEPHYGARANLEAVEVVADNGVKFDLFPLLSDKQLRLLEADCLVHELELREPDPDFLRDREYDHSY